MRFNDNIKSLIDASVDQPTAVQIDKVEQCVYELYKHILNGYQQSRDCMQFAIGQLNRVHKVAVVKMLFMSFDAIERNSSKFSHYPSNYMSFINEDIDDKRFFELIERVGPLMGGILNMSEFKPDIAKSFSLLERKQIVSHCVDNVQMLGLKAVWDKTIINAQTMFVSIMYSICKEEQLMELFFDWYYNILDRLNTSSQYQLARDFAENLLMIGHQEQMIAEAYLGASKSYTGANNMLAGLLYLNMVLYDLSNRKVVCQRMAYDVIWQLLKIIRGVGFNDKSVIDRLLVLYEGLGMDEYKDLSVYHTAYSSVASADVEGTAKRIEEFLGDKRDVVYKNMEHSSAPWYTLIKTVRKLGALGNYPVMDSFEKTFKAVLLQNGNNELIDLYEKDEGLCGLLIQELAKLETTRNADDIGNDSRKAQIMAKSVLEEAANDENPANFILAMRPKSDFSFAMSDTPQESIFRKLEVVDPASDDCSLPYGEIDNLAFLLQTEKSDCVMWMGCGKESVFRMTLMGNMFRFDELKNLKAINAEQLQKETISKLKFSRTGRDSRGGVYDKSELELNQESDEIYEQLKDCRVSVPNIVNRLFFIKDIELAPIPHQLLIDERTNKFVGEDRPSANVISTEFFIKSNFNDPLSKGYSKSYWSPVGKEGTFVAIKEHLQQLLDDYHFEVDDNDEPAKPLHSDLNIICVHGADNISDTEWFYAGHTPIVNSNKVVGPGKVLVMFACHSGSISYQHYDHSIHTIVKRYLRMGYSSVVAPMWSLNVDIIPIWLPVFMQVIDTEGYVVDAVYKANMEVKKQFVTPSAWACLHLFGNPYMKIADEPILSIPENE